MQALEALIKRPAPPLPEKPTIATGWHILLCMPSRELTAVSGMIARGFNGRCPCDYMRRRTGRIDANGRPVLSLEPSPKAMIPGYAFVKFDPLNLDYDGVKAIPGIRNFYRLVTADPLKPKYAGLRDAEMEDLRTADRLAFERFQESVRPKSKQKPAVEFEPGKEVRFTTKFGKEIYGQMTQKKGGGMVKIITESASYLVPHVDLAEIGKSI